MPDTAFFFDPQFLEHDTGPGHPERPQRLRSILLRLEETGLLSRLRRVTPTPATRALLEMAHSADYIDQAEQDMRTGLPVLSSDPTGRDTRLSPGSLDAALLAAGAVAGAVDLVMDGQVRNAFCCVRPPGHHATRHAGMGFCIFNNVAVGVQYARRRYGLQRILIVDWDVHHGNGTQDIFEEDPDVFYASSHQTGIYPGTGSFDETGSGPGKGAILNMPLPPFTSSEEFVGLWSAMLLPAMEAFRPEFVFISAGFDSHEDDLLGSLGVTTQGFGEMTRLIMSIAHRYAGDRLVSALEGGYNVDALAESVEAHVRALLGE